jgi:hypothetical protein
LGKVDRMMLKRTHKILEFDQTMTASVKNKQKLSVITEEEHVTSSLGGDHSPNFQKQQTVNPVKIRSFKSILLGIFSSSKNSTSVDNKQWERKKSSFYSSTPISSKESNGIIEEEGEEEIDEKHRTYEYEVF